MENFNINHNNEFQENSNGPITLDGRVSPEEREALETALEGEKDIIHDTTEGKLAQLLHEDILQNIDQFSPELQEDLRALAEIHPYNSIDLDITISEDIQEVLNQDGLEFSMDGVIDGIQEYLSSELQLPSDSILSGEEFTAIQNTLLPFVTEGIETSLGGIDGIVSEALEDNPNLSIEELRWIINSKIVDYIKEHNNDIFAHMIAPLQLYLKYSSEAERERLDTLMREEAERAYASQRINDEDTRINRHIDQMVENKYNSFKQEFRYFERTMKDSFIRGNISSPDELRGIDTIVGVLGTEYYQIQGDTTENLDISLLNEEDREIEGKAMLCYLGAVGIQCLPYIGAVAGVAADGTDIFSSQDATMMSLKEMGIVPEEYNIEKTWIDRVLAGAGIVLSLVGLQSLAKSGKLARAVRGIRNLSPSIISDTLSLFASKMGLGDEATNALKGIMGVEVDETADVANLNRAPNSVPTGKEGRIDIPEEIQATGTDGTYASRFDSETMMRNAGLNNLERTREAERVLGRSLEPGEQRALIEAHEYGSDGEGVYSMRELVEKRRILEASGFSREESMRLMDLGLAGDVDRLRNTFSPGEKVIIPRSGGGSSEAYVTELLNDGRVRVEWEENGDIAHKDISPSSLQRIPEIHREIEALDSGFIIILNNGSSGYVHSRSGDTLYVEISTPDGNIRQQEVSITGLKSGSDAIQDIVRYQPHLVQIPEFSNINQAILFIRNMTEPGLQGSIFYSKGHIIEILEDVQTGNLSRIQEITSSGGLRTRVWDSISDQIKRDYIVPHLWPQGIDSHLAQGSIGNCYFLAALRSIKSHPNAQEMLSRIIKLDVDGSYIVRFPGDAHQREIRVTARQVQEMQEAGGMQGSLGDMILERAYARLAREQQEGVVNGGYTGRTIIQPLGSGERGKMAIEGGWMIKTLREIFGRFGRDYNMGADQMVGFLDQINETNRSSVILSLSSRFPDGHQGGRVDNFRYFANDADGNPLHIFYGHAYGIEDIDTVNRRLMVVNPHSTAGERFWMTYEQVAEYFGGLQGIGIDMNDLGNWFATADWLGDDVLMQAAAGAIDRKSVV